MVNVSRKDLERLAIGFGIADFLTEGRLSAPIARATKKALVKAAPAIGRGIIRYGPRVAITAARVTPTPLAAAATGAALYQNRDLVADLASRGYGAVAPPVSEYLSGVAERATDPSILAPMEPRDLYPFDVTPRARLTKQRKKVTKFNKAVKAGMSAVKKSTSYGKRGTINNAKKAFSAVTKVASKVNKGAKVSAKGVTGTIARAVRKIL